MGVKTKNAQADITYRVFKGQKFSEHPVYPNNLPNDVFI